MAVLYDVCFLFSEITVKRHPSCLQVIIGYVTANKICIGFRRRNYGILALNSMRF